MPALYDLDTYFQAITHFVNLNALVRDLHENRANQSSFTSRTNRACFREFKGFSLHGYRVCVARRYRCVQEALAFLVQVTRWFLCHRASR